MRIQHNIMAMSAYRNYTNNVSAMQKNLEKLSSGYKINRAGDDAAGLAISEKMRAQITGLQTAQKNAKDGISLVQTAEGALTEVHDMLNRMVELATQSANGTYEDGTDRTQLQKEVNQLLDEINRIADSANFNGINLLDGSMNAEAGNITTFASLAIPEAVADNAAADVGSGTIVHTNSVGVAKTSFNVDFNNAGCTIGATAGDTAITLAVGDDVELTLTNQELMDATGKAAGESVTGADIANAFATKYDASSAAKTVNFKGAGGADQAFTLSVSGNQLTFAQTDEPATADEVVNGKMAVTISGLSGSSTVTNEPATFEAASDTALSDFDIASIDFGDVVLAEDADVKIEYVANGGDDPILKITVGDTLYQKTFGDQDTENAADLGGATIELEDDAGNKITATLADTVSKLGYDKYKVADAIAEAESGTMKAGDETTVSTGKDYNASTEVITQGQAAASGRLASTYIEEGKLDIKDGAALKVGDKTYVFKVGANSTANTEGAVVVDLSNMTGEESDFKKVALTKLTLAAEADGNDMFSIGYDNGRLTFTEQDTYQATAGKNAVDLSTQSAIAKQFGFAADGLVFGRGLMLQIGDTKASYNQLKVNINDCHADALGVGGLDISTQDAAQNAIDKIKDAINTVSDVRGTLGATQNRLDHTINNLSVMTENIQDAESTIRDVDVAEEMMAYTKNNILIQSAQAMLAQANQVPQGVLQLLQ